MNKIINKFLLTGDKFMAQVDLKQLVFTYNDGGPFTKHRERIKHLEKQEIQNIYTEMNQTKFVFLMMQHILVVNI